MCRAPIAVTLTFDDILDAYHDHLVPCTVAWAALGEPGDPAREEARRQVADAINGAQP